MSGMMAPFGATPAMTWNESALMANLRYGVGGDECAALEDAHLLGRVHAPPLSGAASRPARCRNCRRR